MDLIQQGIDKGLIKFDEERKFITYIHQNKKRNYINPEEQVQAEAYLKLLLSHDYPVQRIKQFVAVTMGSSIKEADIIVYNDDLCTQPHIVVECKKSEISEMEFVQAIEQAAAYAYALSGTVKYIWITSGIKSEYFLIDKDSDIKQTISIIPRFGVTKIEKFQYAKGGRKKNEEVGDDETKQKYFELEVIGEDELTRRFKQAHNSLWAGGELNASQAFDEFDKLIFCKIWDERKPRKKGEPYDFQLFYEPIPQNATKEQKEAIENKISIDLYNRINALYNEGKMKDPDVFKEDIRLNHKKVRTVVGYIEDVNLSLTDLDSKGKAFETFMGSFFRGDFGAYFTPRNIVQFVVNALPITNNDRILDTSCGSGGFLLYALNKVRKAASEYYPDFEKNPLESKNHWEYWHNFALNNLFGIEINEQIARTAKMNMIIHDDGHTNVIAADGLLKSEKLIEQSKNRGFEYNSFDYIITNPPFGTSIKQTEKAYLHQYNLGNKDVSWLDTKNSAVQVRDNQSTEVLFIEQCWNFLKPGGFLAIVVPDGILTNSSLQYVRDNIEDWYRIVAVVSMPQTAFAHTGAGVKSSVLFLRKYAYKTTESISSKKTALKDKIKADADYLKTVAKLETQKKAIIRNHTDFVNTTDKTETKEIEKTTEFLEWKKEITEQYNQKINDLKEELTDLYLAQKQTKLDDYPIFMAIAEDIGYDATGRDTNKNELVEIGGELAKFIAYITKEERI